MNDVFDKFIIYFKYLLDKYEYYEKIEDTLSYKNIVMFETIKDMIEKKKIQQLRVNISSYGIVDIMEKINSIVNLTKEELDKVENYLTILV